MTETGLEFADPLIRGWMMRFLTRRPPSNVHNYLVNSCITELCSTGVPKAWIWCDLGHWKKIWEWELKTQIQKKTPQASGKILQTGTGTCCAAAQVFTNQPQCWTGLIHSIIVCCDHRVQRGRFGAPVKSVASFSGPAAPRYSFTVHSSSPAELAGRWQASTRLLAAGLPLPTEAGGQDWSAILPLCTLWLRPSAAVFTVSA